MGTFGVSTLHPVDEVTSVVFFQHPIPGGSQGRVGCIPRQHDLVGGSTAHGRSLELGEL